MPLNKETNLVNMADEWRLQLYSWIILISEIISENLLIIFSVQAKKKTSIHILFSYFLKMLISF